MIEKYADALLFEMRDAAAFTLLPDEDDRAAWEQIDERDAQRILRRAQELAQANEVPALRASYYWPTAERATCRAIRRRTLPAGRPCAR